jgi:hypothetical protein
MIAGNAVRSGYALPELRDVATIQAKNNVSDPRPLFGTIG